MTRLEKHGGGKKGVHGFRPVINRVVEPSRWKSSVCNFAPAKANNYRAELTPVRNGTVSRVSGYSA